MTEADLEKILDVDKDAWKEELKGVDELYAKFGDKLPKELSDVLNEVTGGIFRARRRRGARRSPA